MSNGEDLAGSAAQTARMLAVTAYGGAEHGKLVLNGFKKLSELHAARSEPDDLRCRTCRTSKGLPAPWPCDTLMEVGAALGFPTDPERAAFLRLAGEAINGSKRARQRLGYQPAPRELRSS